jgi:hypothetical protein
MATMDRPLSLLDYFNSALLGFGLISGFAFYSMGILDRLWLFPAFFIGWSVVFCIGHHWDDILADYRSNR